MLNQYFTKVGTLKWVFYGKKEGKESILYQIILVPIRRHSLIQDKNPFLPENQEYFIRREKQQTIRAVWSYSKKLVGKITEFNCKVCGLRMFPWDETQIHHKLSKKLGGKDEISNLILLHKECHKQITYSKNTDTLARFKNLDVLV